jgi:spore maturation protein CgeB
MKIVVYGLSITSSWGNGHATTYRSLLKALARRGHSILFIEKDVPWYRDDRDMPHPEFCSVRLYQSWQSEQASLLALSLDADAVVVGSYFPDAIPAMHSLVESLRCPVLFYDIDTPVTLAALRQTGASPYLTTALIPHLTAYLSFTGGPVLNELEHTFGARRALAFYCSVDPDLYRHSARQADYECDLSYLGTYAADRQPKLTSLLDGAARLLPRQHFLVAGPLYPAGTRWQPNVEHRAHIPPPDHPAFYCSSRFTLNLTRNDMVEAGYSPSVRLFEASACGATILSDLWPGLGDFLTPGEEILVPTDAEDVARILIHISDAERAILGGRARERILAEHTSAHRALQFEQIISNCQGSSS